MYVGEGLCFILTSILLLGSTRCAGLGLGLDAEIIRETASAPDVAADIERARVELGPFVAGAVLWLLSVRHRGSALCVSHRARKGGRSLAQANDSRHQRVTPSPAPCLLVELHDVALFQAVSGSDGGAAVVLLDSVLGA